MSRPLRVGETARLNSVRNPKSEIKNCDGLPSRSLGADPLKHHSTRRLFVNSGVAPIFPFGRAPAKAGAGSRIRTDDLLITNQLLYQLSYAGIYEGE